jgi:hypothetical protein
MRNAEDAAHIAAQRAARDLAGKIKKIDRQAKSTRSTGFHVPTLNADPAADDPTNLWLLEDGRLRARTVDGTVHEYLPIAQSRPHVPTFASDPAASTGWRLWFNGGTSRLRGRLANGSIIEYAPVTATTSSDGGTPVSGSSTSTKPKPSDPTPKKYVSVYPTTWTRMFCVTHGIEAGGRYGTFPGSYHGMRRIMFGFNDSAIRADLAGSTIRNVELRMRNLDSWSYSGIDVHFGAHNKAAAPDAFSAVRRDAWKGHWPAVGGGHWRNTTDWFGKALRDNTIKGLTIDQPSGSSAYYGEMDRSSLELRITHTK